jgi:DNA-binding NarL/FixJ family response regulator
MRIKMETTGLRITPMRITPRENDLLRELLTGAANKEIAFRLGLTEGTIKVYFAKLSSKLAVGSRVGMALWAERSGAFHYPAAVLT